MLTVTCSKCRGKIGLKDYAEDEYCPTCHSHSEPALVLYMGFAVTCERVPRDVHLQLATYRLVTPNTSALDEGGWIVVHTFSYGNVVIDGFHLEEFAKEYEHVGGP